MPDAIHPAAPVSSPTVPAQVAVRALALAGDLSMGQPPDQSVRAARLAVRLAQLQGADESTARHAALVSLLRWSGCTANAAGFATLLGDDVGGREAMLRQGLPEGHPLNFANIAPLAHIHCEVAGEVAALLGLPGPVETGLRHVWEHYDGSGAPRQLTHEAIPPVVYLTSLAGDLEILSRTHPVSAACQMILQLGGVKYPSAMAQLAVAHAPALLAALEQAGDIDADLPAHPVALSIVAELIELKLPWLTGYSRRVAELAVRAAALAGLDPEQGQRLERAALLHGIGRASVSNTIWERPGRPSAADWERIRLAPYWTARAGALIPALRDEAELASRLYERLDGSGYFRNLDHDSLAMPARLLAAAAALAALCAPRPWRSAMSEPDACQQLQADAQAGLFDPQAVQWVVAAAAGQGGAAPSLPRRLLSEREAEVLRRISLGESNKEAARAMQISPSTVRTHVESIFRKLQCSTRAAATLKGLSLGLI